MNFTEIKEGCVRIIHHSTSSTIEIVVSDKEEVRGDDQTLWLDYYDFYELLKALKKIDIE